MSSERNSRGKASLCTLIPLDRMAVISWVRARILRQNKVENSVAKPVIREIERVSKPGRRVYASVKNLPRINNGLGVAVVSTPKGVMADHEARDANVGGEILFTVF